MLHGILPAMLAVRGASSELQSTHGYLLVSAIHHFCMGADELSL